jgi:hypothetical protein
MHPSPRQATPVHAHAARPVKHSEYHQYAEYPSNTRAPERRSPFVAVQHPITPMQSRAAFLGGLGTAAAGTIDAILPPACDSADPTEYSRLRFFDTCVSPSRAHARTRANKRVRALGLG